MAKGYWITFYRSISDPAALAGYAKLAGPAIVSNGGRFLARGGTLKTYEQGISQRTTVIEFDSVEQAIAAHDSPPIKRHSPCSAIRVNATSVLLKAWTESRSAPAVSAGPMRKGGVGRSLEIPDLQHPNIIVGRFGVSRSIAERVLELTRAA